MARRASFSVPVLVLGLVSASACHRGADVETGSAPSVAVAVQPAAVTTLRDLATASGTIVPSPAADLTIFAPDSGEVVELPKKEGDDVAVGDVLARFEFASLTQELAAHQLAVVEATSRVERAKTETTKYAGLVERGLAPRNALDNSRAEQLSAESALTQATAQLEMLKLESERTTVRARFPGKVLKVWHREGDAVLPGTTDPVLRVVDPARVQAAIELPIVQLARVLPGQLATVRAIGLDTAEPATVAAKPATLDPSVATGQVRVSFVNPTTLALDAPVSVEIVLDQRTNALVIPATALARDQRGAFVMVVADDGVARRHDVGLGLVTKDAIEIVSGLKAGDRVITSGLADVTEGASVTIAR